MTLHHLHQGGITGTFLVPTMFHAMFALEPELLDRLRGHTLRALMSNAAPLPQRTKEVIVDYFGDDCSTSCMARPRRASSAAFARAISSASSNASATPS